MGAVWGFSAMPMMESAFIMAECGVGVDRCGVVQNCSSEHNSTIFREVSSLLLESITVYASRNKIDSKK